MMKTFDELWLLQRLKHLPCAGCTAFALSAASRQIQSYELYVERMNPAVSLSLKEMATVLWGIVLEGNSSNSQCESFLAEMMAFEPEENEGLYVWPALAEDAIASLCYAVRHILNSDPQEAVWAARCAYEAADQAAIPMLNIDLTLEAEKHLLAHPAVQRELKRQERDIAFLEKRPGTDGLLELKRLSSLEHFLEHNEIISLG